MPNQESLVIRVRAVVRERLAQLTRSVGQLRETYQFSNDNFHGIRFEQASFYATWKMDETKIYFFHEEQQILVVDVAKETGQKLAA